jgi:hypothetical protein
VGDRWYVDSSRTAIDWETAVVDGEATTDIFEVTLDPMLGAVPLTALWARDGRPVSEAAVEAAQVATSEDPIPTDPATEPTTGGSGGGQLAWQFSVPGDLVVAAGDGSDDLPMLNGFDEALTITDVVAAVGEAPTGADAVINVLVDGASIFDTTGHRTTIPDGETESTATVDNPEWPAGAQVAVRVTQVGSTTPGARLTGYVLAQRA